jgi:shikimate dehydrogenase
MMNAAFRAAKVSADYKRVSIPEPRFPREFQALMDSGFSGMNVTIPYKTLVIKMIEGTDAVATRTNAVNTVKAESGGYTGYNTDPDGIVGALGDLPASLDIRNALLIGAGGAARAFCEAMNRIGCVDVGVAVRDTRRAAGFVVDMEKADPKINLTLAGLDDLRRLSHDLIFNATPMGAKGEPLPKELERVLPGTKVTFDAVYTPRVTSLLAEARRSGSKVVFGEDMLLYQGMAAFSIWTGKKAPKAVMKRALASARTGEN